jgi:hypothetical protein
MSEPQELFAASIASEAVEALENHLLLSGRLNTADLNLLLAHFYWTKS